LKADKRAVKLIYKKLAKKWQKREISTIWGCEMGCMAGGVRVWEFTKIVDKLFKLWISVVLRGRN
jgi:hypothetical protein